MNRGELVKQLKATQQEREKVAKSKAADKNSKMKLLIDQSRELFISLTYVGKEVSHGA